MAARYLIGIDLGTTNSALAYIDLKQKPKAGEVVGEFAGTPGSRAPGRLVSSAKSWLSHSGVDRAAALLPWGAPPDVPRLSPLDVSARYLRHLVHAWNHVHAPAGEHLERQPVVLTVPASF